MIPGKIAQSVDAVVLSNLDAAYRLARWHFRNQREAEDVVQEAAERAFRRLATLSAGTARAWFLRIVSQVCDERRERVPTGSSAEDLLPDPGDPSWIDEAIRSLPAALREVLVLRDLEGLSYRELADVMGVSAETVTTSLSRSRQALSHALARRPVAV